MTYIPPNEVATFRALKSATIVLMIMFRLDKPTGENEIAEILDMHPSTVRTRLLGLKRLGLVTRTHRYRGWLLTQGGRQLLLGSYPGRWEQYNPDSVLNQDLVLSAKNSRSHQPAAAALSLSFNSREEQHEEAAEDRARRFRAQNESQIKTNAVFPRSRLKGKHPKRKRKTADVAPRFGLDLVQRHCYGRHSYGRNLEALQSVGLGLSAAVRRIAKLDHVNPDYITSQARRLEGEGRYSAGLLIKVIRDADPIPPRYQHVHEDDSVLSLEIEPETTADDPGPQPDASVNEPASPGGPTAVRAWEIVIDQLQTDMPKAAFETWVKNARLLSFFDGTFVIHAHNAYNRDWLESRLTSTIVRLLTGICNRHVEVKFTDIVDL